MPLPSYSSDRVQAALGLGGAAPAAGAFVRSPRPRPACRASSRCWGSPGRAAGCRECPRRVIRFQTSFLVQLASGLIFTRPNFLSQPTIGAWARSGLWSRRMPLIQACIPAAARCSTLILRSKQHWSGFGLVQRPAVERLRTRAPSAPAAAGRPRCRTSRRSGRAGRASPGTGSRCRG